MPLPRFRATVVELLLWTLSLLAVGYFVGVRAAEYRLRPYLFNWGTTELRLLAAKYGPGTHSENGEEWILRDFFGDKRGGVFVDVGANHYEHFNNTFYLETALGWSGIAVEPQAKFAPGYAAHRPRTRFVPLFVSDAADRTALLYVPPEDMEASSDQAMAARGRRTSLDTIEARTTTLDDVLERSGLDRVDFLSLDIELNEPKALAGFSIERFKPALVSVEAHLPVRQAILDYFQAHRYRLIGKYLRADERNLWFQPPPDGAAQ